MQLRKTFLVSLLQPLKLILSLTHNPIWVLYHSMQHWILYPMICNLARLSSVTNSRVLTTRIKFENYALSSFTHQLSYKLHMLVKSDWQELCCRGDMYGQAGLTKDDLYMCQWNTIHLRLDPLYHKIWERLIWWISTKHTFF